MHGLLLSQTGHERVVTMAVYKRSEESLSSLPTIGGWKTSAWSNILKLLDRLVNERYQGFPPALAAQVQVSLRLLGLIVTPHCMVALARGQTVKQRRSVRNDMCGVSFKEQLGVKPYEQLQQA